MESEAGAGPPDSLAGGARSPAVRRHSLRAAPAGGPAGETPDGPPGTGPPGEPLAGTDGGTAEDLRVPDPGAPGPADGVGAGRRTGLVLLITGLIGWLAAFRLTVDADALGADPSYVPACDINDVVGCGGLLTSWQGSLLGFSNMLLGLGAFAVVATLGAAVLGGARLHRVLWLALQTGTVAGLLFVHWLIQQSLYELNKLCPYCVVVWIIVIPLFWYVTLHNLEHRIIPVPDRGRKALQWVLDTHWVILGAWYAVIALLVYLRFQPF
ncbi:vitamin K epoxide reductase family protein [Streptomyces sp. ACA25]|uniref:vitamin K epoxide reductase family protein n=1 Tax=Streptomyces sp. ACA25 TaxID=3022596 RepID=UPI002307552A|nr:vitamin K epoxide reductase family protein [Streptomyces sp. ACA25]MDB1088311.1 vitamin K epoxide reductase family protein [Streptomyces sp. ACA25]